MRIAKIQTLSKELLTAWHPTAANNLMQELHNLRGVSGSHNLVPINETSAILESQLDSLKNKASISIEEQANLQKDLDELIRRMNYIFQTYDSKAVPEMPDSVPVVAHSKSPLILIVDDDKNFCDMITVQLEHLGYRTRAIYSLNEFKQSLEAYKPQAIFMDIIFKEERDAGTQMITAMREKDEVTCPVIYMSARDDMQARLNAVRSGGVAFLCKTFNLGDLKTILDLIVPLQKNIIHKVLIIDDDKISAEYCTAILEHAGIQVTCLDSPENVFEDIVNFDPDVILLDMYMPNINGVEMASVIRQHQNFAAIPIVIMSGETDINKQFKMRSAGADDFILKPFKPHHLVDTILNRIQRSRQTKHLIYTDGLTGLMLFSKIKDQITNLLDSCVRYNLDFSVALIDLDHFKTVNDTYGHLTGDQILRGFAEFLLARVRKSDIVTRSGGEEFTIVFPYTSGTNAQRAVKSFAEAYSHRIQHANGKEFTVTFSAGVASVEHYQELESILSAADQALYRAKENGRNSTELSD
jgi:diguanylate cyclase (GGDEF)-like protein